MKAAPVRFSLCLILISLFLFFSCDRFPSDPDLADPQDALYVLVQAHALKQLWIYHYFETFSNGYEEGQLFVYEPTELELESLYEELNTLLQYKDDVIVAAQTLTDSLGLTPSPLSKTSGIFGSLFDFFSEGAKTGERNRDRILLVVSNMSPEERNNLFHDQLRSKWKNEFLDENDFWTKLQNGDLDDRTGSIYNDFYDNSDLNNRFVSLANDRNLSPGNIFVKEGANLTEKGMDVVIEATKIATPLGKGMDMVDEGKKWWEKAEKAVDKPLELIGDEIKERVAGKVAGMVDIDGAVNASGLGEKTATAVKILSDISFGTDDTQELYEKAIDWGVAKITSPDKSITPDVIVAENKNKGSSFPDLIFGVGNYVNRAGEMLMSLPAGNWDVTAVDKNGQNEDQPRVIITAGQETEIVYEKKDKIIKDLQAVLDSLEMDFSDKTHLYLFFNNGNNEGSMFHNASTHIVNNPICYPLHWSGYSFSRSENISHIAYDGHRHYRREKSFSVFGTISLNDLKEPVVSLEAEYNEYYYLDTTRSYVSKEWNKTFTAIEIPLWIRNYYGTHFEFNTTASSQTPESIADFTYDMYSYYDSSTTVRYEEHLNGFEDPEHGYMSVQFLLIDSSYYNIAK
jgi:hypothetical protein